MAGIYLHIPFCRKACHYCNFHFSTNLKRLDEMVAALCREIDFRKNYFKGQEINTLYFGGGTPSILTGQHMIKILGKLNKSFDLSSVKEFTIEINPEDINPEKLKLWRKAGVNRLSIGVQSFFEEDLQYMNRNHSAAQSEMGVKMAQDHEFDNITVDLIFGAHSCNDDMWSINLDKLIALNVNHASVYGLTVEENTALAHFIKSGKISQIDEGKSVRQFSMTIDSLTEAGYEQYEISNYAKEGFESMHNSSYWNGELYLGLGPSAHSFDGVNRFWSINNNNKYINQAKDDKFEYELERLSKKDLYNERVMTGFRLKDGVGINTIKNLYPSFSEHFKKEADRHILLGNVYYYDGRYALTKQGKFISDAIASDFFEI